MGTKNDPGRFDCYDRAEGDEPMFVLLARDPLAPDVVRTWADAYEERGGNPEKVAEARACANEMERWTPGAELARQYAGCPIFDRDGACPCSTGVKGYCPVQDPDYVMAVTYTPCGSDE